MNAIQEVAGLGPGRGLAEGFHSAGARKGRGAGGAGRGEEERARGGRGALEEGGRRVRIGGKRHLEVLKWLQANGCTWDAWVCASAARALAPKNAKVAACRRVPVRRGGVHMDST